MLFQKYNALNLDILTAMRFLAMVEEAYHPENCYHNSTHAADVTQALHCLLKEPKVSTSHNKACTRSQFGFLISCHGDGMNTVFAHLNLVNDTCGMFCYCFTLCSIVEHQVGSD